MALFSNIATLVAITFFEMYFPLLLNIFLVVVQGHSKLPPVHFTVSGKVAFVNARTATRANVVNGETNCPWPCIVFLAETKTEKPERLRQLYTRRCVFARWRNAGRKISRFFFFLFFFFFFFPLYTTLRLRTRKQLTRDRMFDILSSCWQNRNADVTIVSV